MQIINEYIKYQRLLPGSEVTACPAIGFEPRMTHKKIRGTINRAACVESIPNLSNK